MLTAKQHELLNFIHERLSATGVSPSFDEMREALDLKSKSGVHRLISALEERQFIRRLPNRARAIEVIKMPRFRCTAGLPPARRSKHCKAPKVSRSPPRYWDRASIMRSKSPAIRWLKRESSTGITH